MTDKTAQVTTKTKPSLIILVAIIIIGSLVAVAIIRYNSKSKNNNTLSYVLPSSYTTVQKAAARFEILSNGLPIKALEVSANKENSNRVGGVGAAVSTQDSKLNSFAAMSTLSARAGSINGVLADYSKDIDSKGVETVYEVKVSENSGEYGYGFKNLDKSKSFTETTLYSPRNNKTEIKQNGKIISFYSNTPTFDLQYRGGKYAVKTIHDEQNGIFYGNSNPEIFFLNSIIKDTSGVYKKLDSSVVNGKSYDVYEFKGAGYLSGDVMQPVGAKMMMPINIGGVGGVGPDSGIGIVPPGFNNTTKYFVDPSTFELVKEARYDNDNNEVYSRTKVSIDTYTDYNDKLYPSNTEVKEVKANYNIASTSIENLAKDYALILPTSKFIDANNAIRFNGFDNSKSGAVEIQRLVSSSDFDPDFVKNDYPVDTTLASFGSDSFQLSISTDKPISSGEIQKLYSGKLIGGDAVAPSIAPANISQSDVIIDINGEKITAIAEKSDFSYSLIFQYKTKWYNYNEFQQYDTNGAVKSMGQNINFRIVEQSEGAIIDNAWKQENISNHKLKTVKLTTVDKSLRYLPGDLTKYEIPLRMNSLATTDRSDSCFDSTLGVYAETYLECYTEKNKGTVYYFNTDYVTTRTEDTINSNKPAVIDTYYSLSWAVMKDTDITDFGTHTLRDYSFGDNPKNSYVLTKDVDNSNHYYYKTNYGVTRDFYLFKKDNITIVATTTRTTENGSNYITAKQMQSLFDMSSFDRDLDALDKQSNLDLVNPIAF
jgi:hypothetical protein